MADFDAQRRVERCEASDSDARLSGWNKHRREVMEWQPIDTAPGDTTPVDLWRKGERLTNMMRVTRSADNIYYEPVESGYSCVRDASHWMPLPAPPLPDND